jgi:ParB family transcriptional regulator, chromosome partitioning protein
MSDYEQIARKAISWPEQERKHFGAEELEELAATIRVHGILEPIGVVRNGDRYIGLWGERRCRAAELAGLDVVPAVVREKPVNEAEAVEIRLIENIAREGLRPCEQAAGVAQLMKAGGFSASEVAKRVGMKPAAVSKALPLLRLPDSIRQKIDAGIISAGAGYELARVEDPKIQAEFAEQVARGSLSRDALAGRIKASKRVGDPKNHNRQSRITAKLSGKRLVTVRASDLTVESVVAMLEELLARCRAARNKGLGLGTMLKVLADESRQSS